MDEAAEQIPSANVSRAHWHRVRGFGERRGEGEGAMGPAAVVVVRIAPERSIEVSSTEDQ